MNFIDEAHIKVKAGDGGSGAVSFRREKYIPYGGPDGGNGGKGGSIIFLADHNQNTLSNFLTNKHFRAKNGESGHGGNCFGAYGEDLILKVPTGTLIREEKEGKVVADLAVSGQTLVVARGGRGGKGNANFKSSVRQAPDFSELGEPGEEKDLYLELKLIAEVAIIGYPSVGKSTLISRISNARPKIADYPFTTLIPNLGMVKVDGVDFVVADIPGLIEGAHEGKGLGIQFLRHIERSRFLIHLLDLTREDLKDDYKKINQELKFYSKTLAKRKQLLVLNKADAVPEETIKAAKKAFRTKKPLVISSVSGKGLKELLYLLKEVIITERKAQTKLVEPPTKDEVEPQSHVFRPHLGLPEIHNFTVTKEGDAFRIRGKRIEQIAVMTNFTNTYGVHRLRDILKKCGAQRELKRAGAKEGDMILIGKVKLEFAIL